MGLFAGKPVEAEELALYRVDGRAINPRDIEPGERIAFSSTLHDPNSDILDAVRLLNRD